MIEVILLIVSLAIILASAEFFTNGIEWLGKKLCLSESAVGSILAAVGTALPEAMIPVIAILFTSSEDAAHIGIGAILGAPFMLSTLAFFITGIAGLSFRYNGSRREEMMVNHKVINRDLGFFLFVYSIAIGAAFLNSHVYKIPIALLLVLAYGVYVYSTLKCESELSCENLPPLYCARKNPDPGTYVVVFQVMLALAGIVMGAHLFVGSLEKLAHMLNISPFILSVIITPIATELPEKFNSIIWVRQGKDTLAMGNITGAMVFQSSIIPAIGIVLTPWELSPEAFMTAILALASAGAVYFTSKFRNKIKPVNLMFGGALYIIYLLLVFVPK